MSREKEEKRKKNKKYLSTCYQQLLATLNFIRRLAVQGLAGYHFKL